MLPKIIEYNLRLNFNTRKTINYWEEVVNVLFSVFLCFFFSNIYDYLES